MLVMATCRAIDPLVLYHSSFEGSEHGACKGCNTFILHMNTVRAEARTDARSRPSRPYWSRRMSWQQELMTNRLVHVISSIQRERRSGVLMAKRGEGITLEEGTLVFVNGQITEAHVGRLREAEARNWLSTWGSCRFMFVPTASETEVHVYKPSLPIKGSAARSPTRGPPPHMINTNWSDPQTPMPSSKEGQEEPQRTGAWERNEGHARTDTPAARAPYPIQQPDA